MAEMDSDSEIRSRARVTNNDPSGSTDQGVRFNTISLDLVVILLDLGMDYSQSSTT